MVKYRFASALALWDASTTGFTRSNTIGVFWGCFDVVGGNVFSSLAAPASLVLPKVNKNWNKREQNEIKLIIWPLNIQSIE